LPRKRQLLASARAVLIPSRVAETSSLVAMEALACGTPVIAYRSGALPEIVDDGVTGFVVDGVDGLVRALERIDEIDRRRCRAEAERRFDAREMAARYLALYADRMAACSS
jgi:glycosyltransferase involved in cell wall biosynthesis